MATRRSRRSRRVRSAESMYEALKRHDVSEVNLREFRRQFTSLALSEANMRRVIREAPLAVLMSIADHTGVNLHREEPRPYMTKLASEIVATLRSRRRVKPPWNR
jgi:hypothetical protein